MALYLVEITHKVYVSAPDSQRAIDLAAAEPDLSIHDCSPEISVSPAYAVHASDLCVVPIGGEGRTTAQLLADERARIMVRDFGPALSKLED